MIIGSNSTNFIFNFPKGFFREEIEKKYKPYVHRMPLPWDNVTAVMNAHVQSITMPSLNMDPVSQTRRLGKDQAYKSGQVVPDLFSKEMTVTMKALDGYINYWIFLENALMWLDFDNVGKDKLYFEDIFIRILSQEGHVVQTLRFNKPLLTSISEISLSYSDNNPEFKTFDCTFRFNALDVYVEKD